MLKSKLIKLEIPPMQIDKIKKINFVILMYVVVKVS